MKTGRIAQEPSRARPNLLACAFAGLGAIMLLSGCAGLNQLVRGSRRNDYFPLAVGNSWDYRLVTTAEQNGRLDTTTVATYLHRITGTNRLADGKPAFMRVWTSQVTLHDRNLADSSFSESETTWFRRTPHAVYRYLTLDSKPDSILLLPVAIDQQWSSAGLIYSVMAREDISAGSRTFPGCWRVKLIEPGAQGPSQTWFAPGIGLVRVLTEGTFQGKKIRTDYYLTNAAIR